MPLNLAVFRADGGSELGLGHLSRCKTLADGLANCGWSWKFAIDSAVTAPETLQALGIARSEIIALTGADDDFASQIRKHLTSDAGLVVIDNYATTINFAKASRAWGHKILVIDDLADRPLDADFLLNQNPSCSALDYADIVGPDCTLMLGADVALLRDDITTQRPAAPPRARFATPSEARLLISLGATDPGDETSKILKSIIEKGEMYKIDIALSSFAPHLHKVAEIAKSMPHTSLHVDTHDIASLMGGVDIAIGAGGTSSLERCCLGLPTVLIETAPNQQATIAALATVGAGSVAADAIQAIAEVSRLTADPTAFALMAKCAYQLCDGKGVTRVIDTILSTSSIS